MAERGVETTIFLNAAEGFLEENWPFGEPLPAIYCDPRTAEPEARCSLHAKCIVVDEARALVTSANFTDRGQTRNIEMGILIAGERFGRDRADEGFVYGDPTLVKQRLGQGTFRLLITDLYQKRCCFTCEKVLPVLQAPIFNG